jgi:hypothetical protein
LAQQSVKREYNTFVKGIVTEAGPLTFPENASLDEENCVLNRDGSRQRRLGMDFEEDAVLRSVTVQADDAITSFLWKNAANDVDNQFAVVQVGTTLFVFDANAPSVSAALIATVNISTYVTGKRPVGFANGLGYLFIAEGKYRPAYLSYTPSTGAVSITPIQIKIRDFFGLDDGLAVETTPASLTVSHNYNLLNQGWNSTNISAYHTAKAVYPSNAQQWVIGKDATDDFDPTLLDKHDFGSSPAPKGRFVIDAFARSTSRNSASGLSTPADIETSYPSTVAFSYERVFYAGSDSDTEGKISKAPNYTGYVFYSRVLRSVNDAGQCHSDADPTSEIDSELVDTDGGYINIPDSGKIYRLMAKGTAVLVFAENGIWAIVGDDGGFRATSHQVMKITDFGVLTGSAIVDAESVAMYWNRGGIYILTPDEISGRLSASNITESTIQTYYNSLPQVSKRTAVGNFDPINRRVSWMYSDAEGYDGSNYKNKYTKELVLDLVLNAFYKNSISEHQSPSPYIAGYLPTPDFNTNLAGVRTRGDSITKYLTVQFINTATNSATITFSYYKEPTFRDWKSLDGSGVSFSSYLVTGYEILEDTMRQKQSSWLVMHLKQTEKNVVADSVTGEPVADNPSGCLVQGQWDWSNSPNSGKWGAQFQAYRLQRPYILGAIGDTIDYGYEVVTTKSRLPGRGRSLSLYIRNDGDKDFYLYGWAIQFSGNSYV